MRSSYLGLYFADVLNVRVSGSSNYGRYPWEKLYSVHVSAEERGCSWGGASANAEGTVRNNEAASVQLSGLFPNLFTRQRAPSGPQAWR